MSIFGYNGCEKAIRTKLKVLDGQPDCVPGERYLISYSKEESNSNFGFGVSKDDIGQLFDYEGWNHVWELAKIKHHKKYLNEERNSYTTLGYDLYFQIALDQFPLEMGTAGASTAISRAEPVVDVANRDTMLGLYHVGAWGINKEGSYCQIQSIYWKEVINDKLTYQDQKRNPRQRKIAGKILMVQYLYEPHISLTSVPDKVNAESFSKFKDAYAMVEGDIKAHKALALEVFTSGKIPEDLKPTDSGSEEHTSTSLVTSSNPNFLKSVALAAERKMNQAEVLRNSMNRNITEMKNRLALQLKDLYQVIEKFKLQMNKVLRLIETLEIYLGVHEDLIQIAEGEPAEDGCPISFRQLTLFADEEFGDPKDQGIGWQDLSRFDAWLVDSGMYKKLVPEQRCVVAIRPRRKGRWGRNMWGGMSEQDLEEQDKYTYILLRNGDNLYRIFSKNISVGRTLFPTRAQFQDLLTTMSEISIAEDKVQAGEMDPYKLEKMRDSAEGSLHDWQKSFLLMQGLIFRTTVLHPIPEGLNLMRPETYQGQVQHIYDAEAQLPSGRLSFSEWRKDINSRIKKGTRVLLAIEYASDRDEIGKRESKDRFTISNLQHDHSVPKLPPLGVYTTGVYDEPKSRQKVEMVPWMDLRDDTRKQVKRSKGRYDHDLDEWVINPEPGALELFEQVVQKPNGENVWEDYFDNHLVVRYNPGDTIYTTGGWSGEYDPHARKVPVGFKIRPEYDRWLFNYDEVTLDDVNFYLESRVDRPEYAHMMNFLYKLRDRLQEELKWEEQFAEVLAGRMRQEIQIPDSIDLISLIFQSIDWYKLEKVVIKRSLTDNDAAALKQVEQRTRYYLRHDYKLKDVDAAVDNRKKTLIWHHKESNTSWVATGMLKQEFIDEAFIEFSLSVGRRRYKPEVTKNRVNRETQETKLEAAVALAANNPGHVCRLGK